MDWFPSVQFFLNVTKTDGVKRETANSRRLVWEHGDLVDAARSRQTDYAVATTFSDSSSEKQTLYILV